MQTEITSSWDCTSELDPPVNKLDYFMINWIIKIFLIATTEHYALKEMHLGDVRKMLRKPND